MSLVPGRMTFLSLRKMHPTNNRRGAPPPPPPNSPPSPPMGNYPPMFIIFHIEQGEAMVFVCVYLSTFLLPLLY